MRMSLPGMRARFPNGPRYGWSRLSSHRVLAALVLGLALLWSSGGVAEPAASIALDEALLQSGPLGAAGDYPVNLLWTIVAAILVFWMQAGFAMLEAGFTRAKNVVNIMMKNLMDFSVGSLAFWAVGFGLMFGASGGWFGTSGFFLMGLEPNARLYAFALFQTVFCATAATIVSGALAERTRFSAYLVSSLVLTTFIYPVFGSWVWGSALAGEGWLEAGQGSPLASAGLPPFLDFAGSTVVHGVGAWAALAGSLAVGPRYGKYDDAGRPRPILGHSMTLSTLGVFILWMGWFGFNAGSTTSVTGSGTDLFGGSGKLFVLIALNTNLAACAGTVGAMIVSWVLNGKPDIGISLNGVLGGLVAITAGCAYVTPAAAVLIGLGGGGLVVCSVLFVERRGVDDPVGAISVHGTAGVWGTLAVAIFHHQGFRVEQLMSQLLGVAACFVWTFTTASLTFALIKVTMGLRVTVQEEIDGLDASEHFSEAYPADTLAHSLSTPTKVEPSGLLSQP